jgi:hypothetical protein
VIQSLSWSVGLKTAVTKAAVKPNSISSCFADVLWGKVSGERETNLTDKVSRLLTAGAKIFKGDWKNLKRQQDASEYLTLLLQAVSKEAKESGVEGCFDDLFGSVLKCPK